MKGAVSIIMGVIAFMVVTTVVAAMNQTDWDSLTSTLLTQILPWGMAIGISIGAFRTFMGKV
jgi:hypothetical protein